MYYDKIIREKKTKTNQLNIINVIMNNRVSAKKKKKNIDK